MFVLGTDIELQFHSVLILDSVGGLACFADIKICFVRGTIMALGTFW